VAEGIEVRHQKGCATERGRRCNCEPAYRASVWSNRERKRIRRSFTGKGAAEAAKKWRADALTALDHGVLRAPKPTTVKEAWKAWYEGAKEGVIRNRSGDVFKPSALRGYRSAMQNRVLPELGHLRLADVRRSDLQDFADGLLAEGLSPSSVQVALLPLRAIYRRAISRGELVVNPCTGLALPAVRSRRERFAPPEEAETLIAAVPERDRATWATAFYAGLRLGELRALRVADVDLAAGVIRVERGWDPVEGVIELKSRAGRRKVPLVAALRDYLDHHLLRTGRTGSELIFGRSPESPFAPNMLQRRADMAWQAANAREREAAEEERREPEVLERITPHGLRHSYAAMMIAAGVNAKALSTFMGHANISVTLDRYGHLMPGSEAEAAELVGSYLTVQRKEAEERARGAGSRPVGQARDNDAAIQRPEAT
jgi:integrase